MSLLPLNQEDYFSPDNKLYSTSKVGLFLHSKEAYHKRYVLGEVTEPSANMLIGKMLDVWFEDASGERIKLEYCPCTKKDCALTKVTAGQMDKAMRMGEQLIRQKFYEQVRTGGSKFQTPIGAMIAGLGICGMPDAFNFKVTDDGKVWPTIYDLKTTAPGNMDQFAWDLHCEEYNYYMQFGVYEQLVKEWLMEIHQFPEFKIQPAKFYHLVVGSQDKNGIFPMAVFNISNMKASIGWDKFLEGARKLKDCPEFVDKSLGLEDCVVI